MHWKCPDQAMTQEEQKDIEDRDDIVAFVDRFYEKVRADELLAPVFHSKIAADEWQFHLNRMYDFWNAMIFYADRYEGNPLAKHMSLEVEQKHFDRWLSLFHATIDELFSGPVAEGVKERSRQIAAAFIGKMLGNRA